MCTPCFLYIYALQEAAQNVTDVGSAKQGKALFADLANPFAAEVHAACYFLDAELGSLDAVRHA